MRIRVLASGIVFGLLSLSAAEFNGTWKLDVAKSRLANTNQIASVTMRIEETGPIYRTIFDIISAAGESQHQEIIRYNDGKEHPLEGVNVPAGYFEISKKISNGQTFKVTRKKDGKVVGEVNAKVSPNGKVLTAKQKGVTAQGQDFDELLVFERQ
jgi:hypothetical protein